MTPILLHTMRRWWWLGSLLVLLVLSSHDGQASHIRAGDIQAISDTTASPVPRRYFFRMVLYTDPSSGADQDDSETIFFGDGTNSGIDAITRESYVQVGPNIFRSVYLFSHTYNADGYYRVSFIGENRKAAIRNLPNSQNLSFYIYTSIEVDPALGRNRTPVLRTFPIDLGAINQVFLHNPGAFDADGDSLAFKLLPSRYSTVSINTLIQQKAVPKPEVIPGYRFPNDQAASVSPGGVQVAYAGPPPAQVGQPAIFVQDPKTGQIVWNSPSTAGEYNFAFVVEEWRRVARAPARLVGEVVRDMQVLVAPNDNERPLLKLPRDICVVAGDSVRGFVQATDPNGDPVDLTAFSSILSRPASQPFRAVFRQTRRENPAAGVLRWRTDCQDVAKDPYLVLFRAVDAPARPNAFPLIDEQTWRITVVGPPPQNLRAQPQPDGNIKLDWQLYRCSNAERILIFRREESASFEPDTCNPGIPASAGYVQIGSVTANTTTYTDNNAGKAFERGKTYCYRIYAEFPLPAGGKSLASAEACAKIEGRPLLLRNVTVEQTSASQGAIRVVWTKPVRVPAFNPPYRYRLYRAEGVNPVPNSFQQVQTFTNPNDTVYVDANLNTLDKAYTYRIKFISKRSDVASDTTTLIEVALPASSVRLEGAPTTLSDTISLTWTYNVPWDNTVRPTRIYRRDPGATAYQLIATVPGGLTGGEYADVGAPGAPLRKNETYCYYVETDGEYKSPLIGPLLNKSQEKCVLLTPVPCPPILTLRPINCDSLAALPYFPRTSRPYENRLTWTLDENNPPDCSTDIAYYRIYYSATQTQNLADFRLIDSTTVRSYVHRNLENPAGCYYVESVDRNRRASQPSNIECRDACLFFLLPNIFTPNGDGVNDTFRPKLASPVRQTKFTVFNRWGRKVYEGDRNPLIEWNGTDRANPEGATTPSTRIVDGMYFYQAEVEFADFAGTKKTYKGWVQITR